MLAIESTKQNEKILKIERIRSPQGRDRIERCDWNNVKYKKVSIYNVVIVGG